MTNQEMIDRAIFIAANAHANQKRKDGTPYLWHAVAVAMRLVTPFEKVVGLLHDVVEDSDWTLEDLADEGFPEPVLKAVEAVTKRKGEPYDDRITRVIEAGELAIKVKLADIDHNTSDQSALEPEEAAFLRKRYGKAQERLEAALADLP